MVFLIVFVTTLILLSSNEAKDKIRKLFRKRMKALDTNDMMKLFNQSQKIAVKRLECTTVEPIVNFWVPRY